MYFVTMVLETHVDQNIYLIFNAMYTPHTKEIMEIYGMQWPTDFCSNRESNVFIDHIDLHTNTYNIEFNSFTRNVRQLTDW